MKDDNFLASILTQKLTWKTNRENKILSRDQVEDTVRKEFETEEFETDHIHVMRVLKEWYSLNSKFIINRQQSFKEIDSDGKDKSKENDSY